VLHSADGGIPPELGNLANLLDLSLDGNELSGSIPPELGNLPAILYVYLDTNRLRGPLPVQLMNLSTLLNGSSDFCNNGLFTDDDSWPAFSTASRSVGFGGPARTRPCPPFRERACGRLVLLMVGSASWAVARAPVDQRAR